MPVRVRGPAACRVPDAYASPMQAEGGNRSERFIRACSSQCVRVATNQRDRFEPAGQACNEECEGQSSDCTKQRRKCAEHETAQQNHGVKRVETKLAKFLTKSAGKIAGKANTAAVATALASGFAGDARYEDGNIAALAVSDPETDIRNG